jgi:hypothetical protein
MLDGRPQPRTYLASRIVDDETHRRHPFGELHSHLRVHVQAPYNSWLAAVRAGHICPSWATGHRRKGTEAGFTWKVLDGDAQARRLSRMIPEHELEAKILSAECGPLVTAAANPHGRPAVHLVKILIQSGDDAFPRDVQVGAHGNVSGRGLDRGGEEHRNHGQSRWKNSPSLNVLPIYASTVREGFALTCSALFRPEVNTDLFRPS